VFDDTSQRSFRGELVRLFAGRFRHLDVRLLLHVDPVEDVAQVRRNLILNMKYYQTIQIQS